jgi:hypothetical protein
MKAICAFCGFRNRADSANCAQCGASLANASREGFRLPWASWAPAIPVALFLWFTEENQHRAITQKVAEAKTESARLDADLTNALQKLDAQYNRAEAEEEAKHRSLLQDKRVTSGQLASEKHALEWSKRQAHDPAFASTLLERSQLEVERLGKDPALTAEAALKKVAERVAPPGSRIEVTPAGERFNVRVAFRLSALMPYEAGAVTIHTSPVELRKEVEAATARVMRELFDYCGSRGIEKLSVSCNRAITVGEVGRERLTMRSLYRASIDAATASQVANWRRLSLADVIRLMKVDHNLLPQITIFNTGKTAAPLDPNEPLEF